MFHHTGGFRVNNTEEIIAKLTDKDDKAACAFFQTLAAESAASDKYLEMIPSFAGLLTHKSSYARTRGFGLIAAQARWASDGQIAAVFDQMIPLLQDPKPITVRQCLAALHEVVLYRPELTERIRVAVEAIDLTQYKDSMSSLIKKDADALLSMME